MPAKNEAGLVDTKSDGVSFWILNRTGTKAIASDLQHLRQPDGVVRH
jgi:hypothetical protein